MRRQRIDLNGIHPQSYGLKLTVQNDIETLKMISKHSVSLLVKQTSTWDAQMESNMITQTCRKQTRS